MLVRNEKPTLNNQPYRIAIVGEAPGQDEAMVGKPFVGASGRFLTALLSNVQILRSACFLGNITQVRPPNNDIENFEWDGPEIQSGLKQLGEDLKEYKPNLCLLLGSTPLYAAKGVRGISDWRGSLFVSDQLGPFHGFKCLPTYHPAYLLRVYADTPLVKRDLVRAKREGASPELHLPERTLLIDLSPTEIVMRLSSIKETKQQIAFDLEGYPTGAGMSCLSIATSPTEGFVIRFKGENGSIMSVDDECMVWRALASVLSDPDIPKVLQNGMYDRFLSYWSHRMLVRGRFDDTMLLHWEKYCELEKNLGLQCSIYTDEPYYKFERKSDDLRKFWIYSGKDSAVTFEIFNVIRALPEPSLSHYTFNRAMQNPLLYMQIRGVRMDEEARQRHLIKTQAKVNELQAELNTMTGMEINVKSPKQVHHFLYEKLKLPVQYKRGSRQPTANYEAMLTLYKKTENPVLFTLINLVSNRTRISDINKLAVDPDGRIRCSYNPVGTNTGRLSSSGSATGSGTNLQNVTKEIRDCFAADEGRSMAQCDLSGADGWTVAAHCAALGDSTMLDDYLYGLKPAKILALMRKYGPQVTKLNRATLKEKCKEVNQDDWEYFCCKCCQHASNYGGKEGQVSMLIFTESGGSIVLDNQKSKQLQNLYFARYHGVYKWWDWNEDQLKRYGKLEMASGQVHTFFGRKDAYDTLKSARSAEPQANTTYATNLAALNLWCDPLNRDKVGRVPFVVEPLLQIHDALVVQFNKGLKDFAAERLKQWFKNELIIHGIKITIPFEGGFGPNWRDTKEAFV